MPDRGDEWWIVQERVVDSMWATYAGPFATRKEAHLMRRRAEERHNQGEEFRVIRCSLDEEA